MDLFNHSMYGNLETKAGHLEIILGYNDLRDQLGHPSLILCTSVLS